MVNTKLTDLTAITTADVADFVYIVDVSDTTDDVAGSSRKITYSNFKTSLNVTLSSDLTDVTITSIASGEILVWNGSAWINNTLAEAGILANVVEDMTPQLGGDLSLNSNDITGTGNITITGNVTLTGNADVQEIDYDTADGEVTSLGNLGTTETIDWANGVYQEGTLDSNVTITHSNEVTGRKLTLVLAYDGTAQRTITWSDVDKWAGGSAPTAPAATGEVLVVTMVYVGTTCYASGEVFS